MDVAAPLLGSGKTLVQDNVAPSLLFDVALSRLFCELINDTNLGVNFRVCVRRWGGSKRFSLDTFRFSRITFSTDVSCSLLLPPSDSDAQKDPEEC